MISSLRPIFQTLSPALALFALIASAAWSPADARPPGENVRQLDSASFSQEVAALVGSLKNLGDNPGAALELSKSLPAKWVVVGKTGSTREEISAEGLKTLLAECAKQGARCEYVREQLIARTNELAKFGAEMEQEEKGAASSPRAAAARSHLDQILKQKEFNFVARPGLWEIWREKFYTWLGDHLDALFGRFSFPRHAQEAAVWGVIAGVFLWLAVWLGRHLARSRLHLLALELPEAAGKTWRDWAREARKAAGEGRHREALHAAYWTAIFRLEDLGYWTHDRTRTPREYLRLLGALRAVGTDGAKEVAATPEQRSALAALTERFEVTWYGYRQASEGDFRHAVAQLETLGCRLL